MSRVVVTGATGMIGSAVCSALVQRGDSVVALSRDPVRAKDALGDGVEAHGWTEPGADPPPAASLAGADAVIHLLGERIDQRWSAEAKRRIRDSRVLSTRMLVAGLQELVDADRPAALVSQSGTGFYGPSDDHELDERAPAGSGFLAGVVDAWEAEARAGSRLLRVVETRTGVVLSPSGGALAKMLPFFRAGVGGPVAGGRQYVPWVHLDDVVGALLRCADSPQLDGPVNVTAPSPATNAELARALGRVLYRPALLPVPAVALRALYGEMSELITTGQRVLPRRLLDAGFQFRHPALEPALRDVLDR